MNDVAVVAGVVAQAVAQRGFDVGQGDPALLQPLTCVIGDGEALGEGTNQVRQASSFCSIQISICSPWEGSRPGPVSRSKASWLDATHRSPSRSTVRSKTTGSNGSRSTTLAPASVSPQAKALGSVGDVERGHWANHPRPDGEVIPTPDNAAAADPVREASLSPHRHQ